MIVPNVPEQQRHILYTQIKENGRRLRGWSDSGIRLFNRIVQLVRHQRTLDTSVNIDEQVLSLCSTTMRRMTMHEDGVAAEVDVGDMDFDF